MRRVLFVLLASAALAGPARADRLIQVPFVTVQTGGGVYVRAPFVTVVVPAQPRVVYYSVPATPSPTTPAPTLPLPNTLPAPSRDVIPTVDVPPGVTPPVVVLPSTDLTPVTPAPVPQPPTPAPVPQQPTTRAVRAVTLSEFFKTFRPQPGTFEVVFVHPDTGAPVRVRFTLPPGSPKSIRLQDHQLQFHYAVGQNVTLRFTPDGGVSVRY